MGMNVLFTNPDFYIDYLRSILWANQKAQEATK